MNDNEIKNDVEVLDTPCEIEEVSSSGNYLTWAIAGLLGTVIGGAVVAIRNHRKQKQDDQPKEKKHFLKDLFKKEDPCIEVHYEEVKDK